MDILSLGMNHTLCAVVPIGEGLAVPTIAISLNGSCGYVLAKIGAGNAIYIREESKLCDGPPVEDLDREKWAIGEPQHGASPTTAWVRVAEGDVIPPTLEIDGVVYHLWFADHQGYQPILSVHYMTA